jgi:hypothetical protein
MTEELKDASAGFSSIDDYYRTRGKVPPGIACPTCGRATGWLHWHGHDKSGRLTGGMVAACHGGDGSDRHPYVWVHPSGRVEIHEFT